MLNDQTNRSPPHNFCIIFALFQAVPFNFAGKTREAVSIRIDLDEPNYANANSNAETTNRFVSWTSYVRNARTQ